MTNPVRLQLSRRKGFNLQALSRAANGLPAINVTRSGAGRGKYGNRYRVGVDGTREECIDKFRADIEAELSASIVNVSLIEMLGELRGNNLACVCPLPSDGEPDFCHAATWLEFANR
jgi:hypothetical protein